MQPKNRGDLPTDRESIAQAKVYIMLMASGNSDKSPEIRGRVTPALERRFEECLSDHGMTNDAMVAAIMQWFVDEPRELRALIAQGISVSGVLAAGDRIQELRAAADALGAAHPVAEQAPADTPRRMKRGRA